MALGVVSLSELKTPLQERWGIWHLISPSVKFLSEFSLHSPKITWILATWYLLVTDPMLSTILSSTLSIHALIVTQASTSFHKLFPFTPLPCPFLLSPRRHMQPQQEQPIKEHRGHLLALLQLTWLNGADTHIRDPHCYCRRWHLRVALPWNTVQFSSNSLGYVLLWLGLYSSCKQCSAYHRLHVVLS